MPGTSRADAGARRRGLRTLLETLALLAIAAAVAVVWWRFIGVPVRALSMDLYPTWIAGRLWLAGHPEAIYHPKIGLFGLDAHPEWLRALEAAGQINTGTSFVYPLPYLWLTTPLSRAVSLDAFAALFLCLNALSALVLGAESMRLAGYRGFGLRLLGGVLVAASFPALYGMGLGQNALPAAALLLLAFRLLRFPGRAPLAAGVALLLLATAFKFWCVLAIPLLLLLRQPRAFAAAALAWAAVFLVAPRVLAPGLSKSYAAVVARLSEVSLVTYNNVSLRSLLHRLWWDGWGDAVDHWPLLEPPASVRVLETALLAAAGAVFCALVLWRKPPRHRVLAAGLGLMLLPLGVCWTHYFVFAIPVALVVALDRELPVACRALGFALLGLLLVPWHPLVYRTPVSPADVAVAPGWYLVWLALPILLTQAAVFSALVPRTARAPGPS